MMLMWNLALLVMASALDLHYTSEAHGPLTHHTIPSPKTVISIGDLHGDYGCTVKWLQYLKLVDFDVPSLNRDESSQGYEGGGPGGTVETRREQWRWTGGNDTVLVFVGDYVDRGMHINAANPLSLFRHCVGAN